MTFFRRNISTQVQTMLRVFSTDIRALPKPIKRVIAAMGLYTFGWGPADAFFSVYLSSFTDDLSDIGLFRTLATIGGAVILLPLGDLLDRVRHDKVIRFSLIMYTLIGAGYFIAGAYLLVPVLVVVLVIHGTMAAVIWSSAESTLVEQSTEKNSSLVFGLHGTVFNTAWALGMIGTLFIAESIPLHYTFLPVSVFSLVSLWLMRKPLPSSANQPMGQAIRDVIVADKLFLNVLKKVRLFPREMWFMYVLHGTRLAFVLFVNAFLVLFLQQNGASLTVMGGFIAVTILPFMFSFIAAELADRTERFANIILGFLITSVSIASLYIWNDHYIHVYIAGAAAVFGAAIAQPSINGIVSVLTPKQYSGEGTAIFDFVKFVSLAVSATVFGIVIDAIGWHNTFMLLGCISLALAAMVLMMRIVYRKANMLYHVNHPDSKKEPYVL